jgi:phenylpropionate dioxygenase-like ring-hydroxylating dioxygenase large terminal subunit
MEIKSLIDPEGGLVNRRIFADREIYELERERLFARCWLYLGHESEVPHPGDFVTAYMGEEPVILCRDLSGRLRAFLNLCRHRGKPGLPRRPRQHQTLHLLLSRLDLLH